MTSKLLQGFYLGDLLIEPLRGRVTGRAGSKHLTPKSVEVLLCLALEPGELVTREHLLDEVWGVGHGSQEALSHAIGEIRHVLDDHPDNPAFVQTLPKRGYRLLVEPELANETTSTVVLGTANGARLADIGFLENLQQRGVLETAIAYLIVGWLLIQIADIVFSQLHVPPWVGTFVTMLVISGFPIAMLLSWFLEFRDGRAIVHQLSPADARRRRFSRTHVSVIGALGLAAVIVFAYDKGVGLPQAPIAEITETPFLPAVEDNSFAVLPFLNVDGSDETRIFASGLFDDVITRMTRVPGLLVSSRGDSVTLAPNSASEKVRQRLRVAMYLEGSVQIADDQIRVTVQLIESATGTHIHARTFNRARDDFFRIRDEITNLTVANVRVALPPDTQALANMYSDDPSLDAYILFRRGVDAHRSPVKDSHLVALDWFDEALAVDPEYAAAHAGKCAVFTHSYEDTGDADFIARAESSCAMALQLNPNLDIVFTALGDLYRTTGRHIEAETAFLAALETNPTNVEALIGLGNTYQSLQQPAAAQARLTQATGLHPGNWFAYNSLGSYLYNSGRYRAAAEQYEVVVALNRDNMIGFNNLGTAYMLAGDFASAAPALDKAIEIEPHASTYSNLGLMLYYLGDLGAAIAAHRRATELAPNDALTWSNLGDALWVNGDSAEATVNFAKAEKLALDALGVNANDPGVLMDLAWISAMLDKHQDARSLIDQALSVAPDDPYAHYIDGLILLRSGNAEGALGSLELAASMGYSLEMLAAEPHLAALRDDARFMAILATTKPL